MKIPLLSIFSAVVLFTASVFAAPVPGLYVGVVTVTKNLGNNIALFDTVLADGLTSVYTLRAQAQVFPDGSITILPTVVESPSAAAEPSSTFIHATPIFGTFPESPFAGSDYAIDGRFPGYITVVGNTFEIYYDTWDNRRPFSSETIGPFTSYAPQNAYTSFKLKFVLRKKFIPNKVILSQPSN